MAWLLDTNVVSELRKGEEGSPAVRKWFATTNDRSVFISVLVLGEIRQGIENIRMRDLSSAAVLDRWARSVENQFENRILPVTAEIADVWGRLSPRERLPVIDGLLAATALHHKLTLVTRNKKDVARSGVACFDPFVD